jgi:hypothetical protein
MAPNPPAESELYRATIVMIEHALSPAERTRLKTYLAAHYDLHGYRERRLVARQTETDRAAPRGHDAQRRLGVRDTPPPAPDRSA